MRAFRLATLIATLVLVAGGAASAIETVAVEDSCSIEGYARSLRQTIVVIDEMAVQPNATGGMTDANRRWLNAVVTLAGVQEGQHNTSATPRERVTVLFVKANGTDVVRVFTGCPPTFSPEEFDRQLSGGGGIGRKFEEWLGKDPRSRIEAEKKAFRTKLLSALVQLTKENSKKSTSSNFLALLPEIGRSFDVGNGIPRIVFFSPLIIPNKEYPDRSAARDAGFRQAAQYAADLKRAEVYLVRGTNESTPLAKDYLSALLLGSKGYLVDWSGECQIASNCDPFSRPITTPYQHANVPL